MNLLFALAAAALFGTGAYLLLSRDLVRVVIGVVVWAGRGVVVVRGSAVVGRAVVVRGAGRSAVAGDGEEDREEVHASHGVCLASVHSGIGIFGSSIGGMTSPLHGIVAP